MTAEPLLDVENLSVAFRTRAGVVTAVRDVSFQLAAGRTLAVLGESGSGKSVTAQAVMGLLDPERATLGGQIRFAGTDLVPLRRRQRRAYQGRKIAMIFQDALAALNPVQPVGVQIAEVLRVHEDMDRSAARAEAIALMERVRIPAATSRFSSYPHQLSGGMRQRIMIAIALALKPAVLIADEPTTALDVTVQAQIIDLLMQLRDESNLALLFITHDLGISADIADEIAVMYAGRIVETGPAGAVYWHSQHPYTVGLLDSVPRAAHRDERLTPIPGSPPSLIGLPAGCAFAPRCPLADDRCRVEDPALRPIAEQHSACHHAEEVSGAHA